MNTLVRSLRKAFLARLAVGVAVLCLAVYLMAVLSLHQSLRNHQKEALGTAHNLTQVLERNVADTLRQADLALWAVKWEAERLLTQKGVQRSGELEAFLQRQRQLTPWLAGLRMTNADGVIQYGGEPVSMAGWDYFLRLRDMPEAGLQISRPQLEQSTSSWVLILARRIERADHGFAGIAIAVVRLDHFQKAFASLDVGPHGSVALRDLELGLVARYPEPARAGTAVGQQVVSPEFRAFARSGQTVGNYEARTPFDGIRRTFAIRQVGGQPFWVLVGLAEEDFLARWRREVLQEVLELTLFTGLILVAAWLIRRAWLRQQSEQEHLARLLAEMKTLGGLLPICSHCKKIRDDNGYWNQLEAYLNEHTDAEFTHGICPDCAQEHFPRNSGRHVAQNP